MMHQYQPLIVAVNKIIASPVQEKGPIAKYQEIKKLCLEAGVGRVEGLHVREILCHKANRGGIGLNAHNAQKNLMRIHTVGANLALLEGSCAVEIFPVDQHGVPNPVFQEMHDFNQALVKKSKEMLAPIGGHERFFSLGCGHTAGGFRAALAQCKTPYKHIADPEGRINPTFLASSDTNMNTMLNVGWPWFVVPQWFTKEVPQFAHLAQGALNAVNNLQSCGNEVETMANMVEDLSAQSGDLNWTEAVQASAATEPACKDYLEDVAKYVREFGGPREQGWPYIDFLGAFANNFGVTFFLGEEFIKTVTNIDFPKTLHGFKMLRCAVMATQLTSYGQRVKDNIGKLLSVSDVNSLKSKENIGKSKEMDKLLGELWDKANSLKLSGKLTQDEAYGLFGRACIRMMAHRFKKQKWCYESAVYDNIQAIEQDFEKELAQTLSAPAGNSKNQVPAVGAASSSESPSQTPAQDSLQAAASKKLNFEKGHFYSNDKQHGAGTWELTELDDANVTFEKHDIFRGKTRRTGKQPDPNQPISVQVSLEDWDKLKEWKAKPKQFKAQQLVCPSMQLNNHFPSVSKLLDLEVAKAKLFQVLVEAHKEQEFQAGDHLFFAVNPPEVFAGRDFGKHELKLIPCPDSPNKIVSDTKDESPGLRVKVGTATFIINGPGSKALVSKRMSGDINEDKFNTAMKSTVLSPFCWVTTTDKESEATVAWSTMKVGDISIPVIINPKKLTEKSPLVIYKEPKQNQKEPAKKKAKTG